MELNCIRTTQDTFRNCYLGPYLKTLTDILLLISIHIMSQTICSRIGEVNWLSSSSVYLIINMGDAWKTSSPTGKKRKKKGRNITRVISFFFSPNFLQKYKLPVLEFLPAGWISLCRGANDWLALKTNLCPSESYLLEFVSHLVSMPLGSWLDSLVQWHIF